MRAEATRISAFTAAAAHALCFAGLAAAYFLAGRGALVTEPESALRLLVVLLTSFPAPSPAAVCPLIVGLPHPAISSSDLN